MPLDQIDVDALDEQYQPNTYEAKRVDEMSFWEHLEELRGRIFRMLIGIVVCIIFVLSLGDWTADNIVFAPVKPYFGTYQFMCNIANATGLSGLCIAPPNLTIITTEMGEAFFMHLQISIVLGLIMSSPFIFWQIWSFIRPGLHIQEAKAARGFVGVCTSLFLLGVAFGYFIIAPFAFAFLANYTYGNFGGTTTMSNYVGMLTMFVLPIGLVFELPVLIYFLSKMGIVTPRFLRNYRRHMMLILLIVSGIITPSPDVASQLLVFVPLYTLFEVGILVSARVEKQREKKRLEEEK